MTQLTNFGADISTLLNTVQTEIYLYKTACRRLVASL